MLQTYKNFTPAVSIIMATYNRAAYLPRSIESVLKQTYKGWELIIVDDGGTDGSYRIITDYLERGAHIRYLKKEHAGPAYARNMGIHCAQAPLITFIDSDDEYTPDHLSLRIEYLHTHPGADLIHGSLHIVGDPYVRDLHDQTRKIHLDECFVESTFFGTKAYFSQQGFREVAFGEGLDLVERTNHISTIERVHWPTYIYHRDTPGSIMNSI